MTTLSTIIDAMTTAGCTAEQIAAVVRAAEADSDREVFRIEINSPHSKRRQAPEPQGFAEFYDAYPKHVDRKAAAAKFAVAVKSGVPPDRLQAAAKRFAGHCRRNRTEPQYIKSPVVWLNKGCWDDDLGGLPLAPPQSSTTTESDAGKARRLLEAYCKVGYWQFELYDPGPESGRCRIPREILAEFHDCMPAEAVARIWPEGAPA